MNLNDSGRVAALWRTMLTGSVVVRTIGSLVRPLPFLARDLQGKVTAVDDEGVVRVIESSVIAQLGAGLLKRIDEDTGRSLAGHALGALRSRMLSLPVWQRIRVTALLLCTAVVVHMLLTGFSAPEPTTLARLFWAGFAGVLLAVMAGAHHVAAAWVDWSGRGGSDHESEHA
jgi:hypothetical protein